MVKFNRKIRDGILIALIVIAVILTSVLYSVFASRHIYNESVGHLSEIYTQVKAGLSQKIELNRKLLKSWGEYINDSVNEINGDDPQKKARRDARSL